VGVVTDFAISQRKEGIQGGISTLLPKTAAAALTAADGLREIIKELI
jgi:hypothetical protein